MSAAKKTQNSDAVFEVPKLNAFGAKLLGKHKKTLEKLAGLESKFLSEVIAQTDVSRPIFVCGLARSGTTVLLEMLSRHPDTASQRYLDFPALFTPYWWNKYLALAKKQPSELEERSHKDGLMVSPESPEAMEEPLWMHYFPHAHEASSTSVMDAETHNPEFEKFYSDHMAKLLAVRGKSRYLAKGNYHVSRMGYLNKLYPGARFILPVRDPVRHIASSMKQHKLFEKGQVQSEKARVYLRQVGHFEFGVDRTPINVDEARTQKVMELWSAGEEVRGWAEYWAMIHDYIADVLETNKAVRDATMIVPYKDLCAQPESYAKAISEHTDLAHSDDMLRWASATIKPQTYYKPSFSDDEMAIIESVTGPAFKRVLKLSA